MKGPGLIHFFIQKITISTCLSLIFIFSSPLHAQYEIKLFPLSPQKCLVVWEKWGENTATAVYIDGDGEPLSAPFQFVPAQDVVFKAEGEFFAAYTLGFGDPGFGQFAVSAFFYRENQISSDSIFFRVATWPWCGTGFLGLELCSLQLGDNLIYVDQYDGMLNLQLYAADGTQRLLFQPEDYQRRAFRLNAAGLGNGSFLVTWISDPYLPFEMQAGVYATIFDEQQQLLAEKLLIVPLNFWSKDSLYYFEDDVPMKNMHSFSDSTYRLVLLYPDSVQLAIYELDTQGGIIRQEVLQLPQFERQSDSGGQVYCWSAANPFSQNRSLFVSVSQYFNGQNHVYNYLIYLPENSLRPEEIVVDRRQSFNERDFRFRSGEREFINARQQGQHIIFEKYRNFELINSTRLNIATDVKIDTATPQHNPSLAIFPNPFSGNTTIQIRFDAVLKFQVGIFAANGQRVRRFINQQSTAGMTTFTWDGRDEYGRFLPSGIYFVRVIAGELGIVEKISLIR